MINKIAVLTSGGDAPGMNAAIRAVTKSARKAGVEVYGIKRGYKGLVSEDPSMIIEMTPEVTVDIIHRGGTILKTARCLEFKDPDVRLKAAEKLKKLGIEGVVVIGGDGSFTGAKLLSDIGVNTIGIPGTIDNDLAYTDYTIGFDTALNTVIDAMSKLRDTSSSHERVSVIEVMGRNCGDIALYAGIAGGAEIVIIPEVEYDIKQIASLIMQRRDECGKNHSMVIVAEGVKKTDEICKGIQIITDFDTRVTVLGHIQRGGRPSAQDSLLASRMGVYATELLLNGKTSRAVGIRGHELIDVDITEALSVARDFNKSLYNITNKLAF